MPNHRLVATIPVASPPHSPCSALPRPPPPPPRHRTQGYIPSLTYSLHYLPNRGFRGVVDRSAVNSIPLQHRRCFYFRLGLRLCGGTAPRACPALCICTLVCACAVLLLLGFVLTTARNLTRCCCRCSKLRATQSHHPAMCPSATPCRFLEQERAEMDYALAMLRQEASPYKAAS